MQWWSLKYYTIDKHVEDSRYVFYVVNEILYLSDVELSSLLCSGNAQLQVVPLQVLVVFIQTPASPKIPIWQFFSAKLCP